MIAKTPLTYFLKYIFISLMNMSDKGLKICSKMHLPSRPLENPSNLSLLKYFSPQPNVGCIPINVTSFSSILYCSNSEYWTQKPLCQLVFIGEN